MERRQFIEICVAATAGPAACAAATAQAPAAAGNLKSAPVERRYERVKLVDKDGKAIKARSLKANYNYVFNYPYASTPCFLLNLDSVVPARTALRTEGGSEYDWPGGVGSGKNIVAYSAICAHKLAYPTRQVSFIGYRAAASGVSPRGKVIACCADKSVYDPAAGAKVLGGPRPSRWRPFCSNTIRKPTNSSPSAPSAVRNSTSFFRSTISSWPWIMATRREIASPEAHR